jgi:hypothetical protein
MVKFAYNLFAFFILFLLICCNHKYLETNLAENDNFNNILKIDTNTIYKKVTRESKNVTGTFTCDYLKLKTNNEVEITACHDSNVKSNGKFHFLDSSTIVMKYTIKSWHGAQKNTDTIYIGNDTLIKIQNYGKNIFIKELYIKI